MDEENISKPQSDPAAATSAPNTDATDGDADSAQEQVFDITPDLNISPLKEESENIATLLKTEQVNKIPLQDISASLTKARTAPANPPAKTLGNFGGNADPAPAPNLVQNAVPHKFDSNLKSIRTFESDVAEVMSHRRTSTASMIMAEAAKKTASNAETITEANKADAPARSYKNMLFILLSIILICGGLASAYYLYTKSPVAPAAAPTATPRTNVGAGIISADEQAYISIDMVSVNAALSQIRAEAGKPMSPNTMKEIVPIAVQNGSKIRVDASTMLEVMDVPVPDTVKRSLDPAWMLGVYAGPEGNKSYFVITTNSFFQNAFSGMLAWEKLMPDDLKQYIYPVSDPQEQGFIVRGQFRDMIIANRDVREYVAADGTVLFLYSFIDSEKLVIASDEEALTQIMTRLEKQSFLR